MGRKSWVDRAVAAGDWSQDEKKARKHLRKSNIDTLYWARYPGRPDKGEKALDGKRERLEKRAPTLARAYKKYRKRGGNRSLPDRILKELGKTRIDSLDRATLRATAGKLYPRLSELERAELIYEPIAEIVGLDRVAPRLDRPAMPGRYDPYLYRLSRKAELEAETKRFEALIEAKRSEPLTESIFDRSDILIDELGNVHGSRGPDWPHWDNPPSEPVKLERGERSPFSPATKRGRGAESGRIGTWGQTDHFTLYMHPLKQNKFGDYVPSGRPVHPGTRIRPGEPPSGNERSKYYAPDGTYLGYQTKAGRPRKPNKLSNAEKQKAYRERKKRK